MRRTSWMWVAVFGMGVSAPVGCNLITGAPQWIVGGGGGGVGAGSSSSSGGGTATGGMDGGQPDGDAAAIDGGSSRGIWSKSFGDAAGAIVAGIAAAPDGSVYITGLATGPSVFGCADADAGAGKGYLVQLDSTGKCEWSFFFGVSAQGTGVAVDADGNVALTGYFSVSGFSLVGQWPPDPLNGQTNSFVALFDSSHALKWAAELVDGGSQGNRMTTGVAVNGNAVAVSGYYTTSLGVTYPLGVPSDVTISGSSNAKDAFVIWLDPGTGAVTSSSSVLITGANDQVANAIALDALTSNGHFAVAGTTSGSAQFDGNPAVTGSSSPSVFLAAYALQHHTNFTMILGANNTQDGHCVAFDKVGDVVGGGTFTGTIDLAGQGVDGGTSYTAANGTGVVVGRYDLTGALTGSLQFGSSTAEVNATIAGIAPYNGTRVTLAGGFLGAAQLVAATSTASISSVGTNQNVYVAQTDATLSDVLWVERYGDGTFNQAVDTLTVSQSNGSIFIAGHFQGGLDFGGTATPLMNMSGVDQVFVAQLSPN